MLLAGSAETHLVGKGAFQELDAIALMTPHTKLAVRPALPESTPGAIESAFRVSQSGRPGPAFVDFPADLIQGVEDGGIQNAQQLRSAAPPKPASTDDRVDKVAELIRNAKAPLIVIGKGAAYARAEAAVRALVDR